MELRPYQVDVKEECYRFWEQGIDNICAVLPTGAGKTKLFSAMVRERNLPTMCIAHRQELVLQISEALAGEGVYHRVVAPTAVQKYCSIRHLELHGKSFVDPNAKVGVAGVQTMLRREDQLGRFFRQVRFWVQDECHHMLPTNQWGRAADMLPNAQGLGVTATPLRLDRQGLDGCFDVLVVGPTMRDLINQGYLADYRIFCPAPSVNRAEILISGSGEFRQDSLRDVTGRSQIVGDVVQNYLTLAAGKTGVVFTVDVEGAERQAAAFRQQGVPATMLSANTKDKDRVDTIEQLKRGDIKIITNCDLLGEGFDAPAIEVVHMARPTQSYGLYVQQFGRCLRPMEGKTHGILIDHVSNCITHGLPDAPRIWSLEGRERQQRDENAIPLRACPSCLQPYISWRQQCPNCGFVPVPESRSSLAEVDGDLEELSEEVLRRMRGEVIDLDVTEPSIPISASGPIIGRRMRDHRLLLEAQQEMRDVIAMLAGIWKHADGLTDREIHRRFYLQFGISILEACALRRVEAERLTVTMREHLT